MDEAMLRRILADVLSEFLTPRGAARRAYTLSPAALEQRRAASGAGSAARKAPRKRPKSARNPTRNKQEKSIRSSDSGSRNQPESTEMAQEPSITPGSRAFMRYASAFKLRYGTFPVRNAKANALLVQLVKRLGEEAPEVAEFYLKVEEPLYVRSGHALDLLVRDAEKIRTTWATGRPGANGGAAGKPWWEVWSGIEGQGDELGIDRDPDNPQGYKAAVLRAAFKAGRLPEDAARKVGVA